MGNTIKSIEVKKLWGIYDFRWELNPGVNVLSGSNGSGKSTVLRCLGDMFRTGTIDSVRRCRLGSITAYFEDGSSLSSDKPFDPDTTGHHVEVVSTFDEEMKPSDVIAKLSDGAANTYLDWDLYKLQTQYLSYQLDVGKRVIAALRAGRNPKDIEKLTDRKTRFMNIVDQLFASTNKHIDRNSDTLCFLMSADGVGGEPLIIMPNQLSSGEKQILIILLSVLVQGSRDMIMVMDEPEVSLHFDWQKRLIADLLSLNPNMQLIIATHSPAVVMNGWVDRVTEISDLISPCSL